MIAVLALAALPILMQVEQRAAALPLCEPPVAIAKDREPYWPGFFWAAGPALMDLGTTEYCRAHNPACYETAGNRVAVTIAKASGVLAQATIDRQIREGQHPRRVRYLRAFNLATQIALSAWNLHVARSGW